MIQTSFIRGGSTPSTQLHGRSQCVKLNGSFFSHLGMKVGTPQRTKLAPDLWLICRNDLYAEHISCAKYANDTIFYSAIENPDKENVSEAINQTCIKLVSAK